MWRERKKMAYIKKLKKERIKDAKKKQREYEKRKKERMHMGTLGHKKRKERRKVRGGCCARGDVPRRHLGGTARRDLGGARCVSRRHLGRRRSARRSNARRTRASSSNLSTSRDSSRSERAGRTSEACYGTGSAMGGDAAETRGARSTLRRRAIGAARDTSIGHRGSQLSSVAVGSKRAQLQELL